MPATVEERMIRLWAGPQGAFKAAMAGTVGPTSNGAQTATGTSRCHDGQGKRPSHGKATSRW